MKSPNILSDIVPVNNDQTLGTAWSPFKEGYFNKIIMSSGAGTNYDYDGSSNYTSMDLPEEEIKGAPAPSPWTSPENFFISGGSPGYWNRTDAGNRPGGHLGIRSGRNSYIEKSDGTFAETTAKPGIGFYASKFGTDHPAASGAAEIKFYGYDQIAVMDNDSIRVDRPLIPYTDGITNIGDSGHNFKNAYIKNVRGNADTASKLNTAVSLTTTDGTNVSDGVDFDGSGAISIKLPSKIAATFSGNLTGDVTGSVTGSSGSCAGNAASSSSLLSSGVLESKAGVDSFIEANRLKFAQFESYKDIGFVSNNGMVIAIPWVDDHFCTQIALDDGYGTIKVRGKNANIWGDWKKVWIEGDAVTGAVWNDLIDCIDIPEGDILEPGYCYCMHEDGHYRKSEKYLDSRYIGIDSDTYSLAMGMETGKRKLNVAVAGFVLAYVDKEYPAGTALTCTENGILTEIKREDKCYNPEMIIATYWKNEEREEIVREDKTVKVNGRKWVKIK